jgi:hypothetical protein
MLALATFSNSLLSEEPSMTAQVITNSVPLGVPGQITRSGDFTVESYDMDTALPLVGFGLPVKNDGTGQATGIVGGDTTAAVLGFLVRDFPSVSGSLANQAFGAATPPTSGVVGILRRGYVCVKNNNGTSAKDGIVYVRTAVPSGAKVVGGIEATADGANTFALTGARFTGASDADGNAEIAFNI